MTIYITPDNKLHDDGDGFALDLPSWPKNARKATQAEIDAIQNAPQPAKTSTQLLAETDTWMDRITEDTVVNLLLKGTVTKADYPQIVWDRINYRRSLRNQQPI